MLLTYCILHNNEWEVIACSSAQAAIQPHYGGLLDFHAFTEESSTYKCWSPKDGKLVLEGGG